MANKESTELTEPCVGSFDDQSTLISSEFSSVLVTPELAVLAVWNDEVDAAFLEPLAQRIGVVSAVGDHAFRFLPGTAFGARDLNLSERGFRKRNFSRRGTFEPNSQRKTATVDQYHPLRALAALGFTNCGAPFLPERSCRPETSPPTSADLRHRAHPTELARRRATHPALTTASNASSRSQETDTCRTGISTTNQYAAPT